LKLDDEALKEILSGLYYPRCPYEFSVMPPELLGNVYEQFLGKVIHLTEFHRARVEEKPEVRKAGGVYYTPQYIVDYIIQNTLGKLCDGKTPKEIETIRILDPACGSGSFLLGAYKFLLAYHRDWYTNDGPQKHRNEIYQGRGGQWFLSTVEKKRILLNNIYGVDIDMQAVEVTKLSLLLKVLEDENSETLAQTLRARHERALPDLDGNIKCGNSLIGPDFYDSKATNKLSEEERHRINAFDWLAEFPAIFATAKGVKKGDHFNVIVGNPPYIFARDEGFTEQEKAYFAKMFSHQQYQLNTFALFTEQAYKLLAVGGRLGFIIPNNWLSIVTMKTFRDFLVGSTADFVIVNNLYKVFSGANVDTSLITFQKGNMSIVHLAGR
jgi:type I restriction-modification system DNA methylase subunit